MATERTDEVSPSWKESCDLERSQESGRADSQVGRVSHWASPTPGIRASSFLAQDSRGGTSEPMTPGESVKGLLVLDRIPSPGQRHEG